MHKIDQSVKDSMKYVFTIIMLLIFFSCGNEKIIQLPEITRSEITEVLDVSPAYIFYDETKPDSVELNRKNLISTTNWLVNVDKRLNLRQAIPSIRYIQNKKRNAQMHKNEDAKNYFTCHNTSINNLGFIEFTNIYYHSEELKNYLKSQNILEYQILNFSRKGITFNDRTIKIEDLQGLDSIKTKVFLKFDKELIFQEYISYKEELIKLNSSEINIDNDEFIY